MRSEPTRHMKGFFQEVKDLMVPSQDDWPKMHDLASRIELANRTVIVGNGGSSAIAGHVAEDWTKINHVPTVTLNDTALMSCFANDYGWDCWIAEALKQTGWELGNNLGIFISSSGNSPNIINGVKAFREMGQYVVTFTGFNKNNLLSQLGDINFHVPSYNYNVVELVHESWLLGLCEIMHK